MTRNAVVVGAGVGGLATSLGLLRAGWDVSILERWPQVVGHGAALGLWPEAQDALTRLGLGDALAHAAVPYTQATFRQPDGRVLSPLPLDRIRRRSGKPVVLLSRTTLMGLLHEAVESHGTAVQVGVRLEDPARLSRRYEVVVGADGLRSAVRTAFFDGAPRPRDCGFTAWRGSVATDTGHYGEVWGEGRLFGITPMEPGRTNWYAAVRDEAPRADAAEALQTLQHLYASWAQPVPDILSATDPATLLQNRVHDLAPRLRSYVSGNVVLVGDAAHAMTPMLGQGACQALMDGEALAADLNAHAGTHTALHSYDRRRRPPTQRFVDRSAAAARISLARKHLGLRAAALRATAPFMR